MIIDRYATYASEVIRSNASESRRALIKPLLNLFSGAPNGIYLSIYLSNNLTKYLTIILAI
jgi:hypothetical protein